MRLCTGLGLLVSPSYGCGLGALPGAKAGGTEPQEVQPPHECHREGGTGAGMLGTWARAGQNVLITLIWTGICYFSSCDLMLCRCL